MGQGNLVEAAERAAQEFERDAGALGDAPGAEAVEALRLAYIGRKGKITALAEGLRDCPKDERPAAGKAINVLKHTVEARVTALQAVV